MAEWMCSGAALASHAWISGKLNELINLFVGDVDASPRRPVLRTISVLDLDNLSCFLS